MAFQLVTLANGLNQYVNVAGGLVPRGAYDPLVSYVIGDMVDYSGSSYVMYNLGPAGTVPTDATYWGLVAQKGNPGSLADFVGNWTSGTNYTPDECVTHNGSSYYCTAPNLAGATNEPGVGVDWNLYWQLSAQAGAPGAPGVGVPVGGTEGQLLAKVDGTDYNTTWIDNTTAQVEQTVKLAENINKGQAVYVSGASGSNIEVSKADNTSDSTSATTLGLLKSTGVTNDQRVVVTEGLIDGLDTNAAGAAGDPVWLGTNGNLLYGVVNKPSAPAHLVFIGTVVRKSATVGEIFVHIQNGWELEELHNVDINSPTNGQILSYDGVTSLWTNTAPPASSDSRISTPALTLNLGIANVPTTFGATKYYNTIIGGAAGQYAAGTNFDFQTIVGVDALDYGGNYNTAFGWRAGYYAGDYNTYLGANAGQLASYSFLGDQSVVIGYNTGQTTSPSIYTRTQNMVVVGNNSKSNNNGVAVGHTSSANSYSTAVGYTSSANGSFATTVGYGSVAPQSNGVAVGMNAYAGAYAATAIGGNTAVYGPYSVTVGFQSNGGTYTVNIGSNIQNGTDESVAIGYGNTHSSQNAISIGPWITVTNTSQYAFAAGYSAKANGLKSISLGYYANYSGVDSSFGISIGASSKLSGLSGTAVGGYSDANTIGSAFGFSATTTGMGGTAIGASAHSDSHGFSGGFFSNAYADSTVAIGSSAYASGQSSIAIGGEFSVGHSNSTGAYSIAIGHKANATGNGSVAIGSDSSGNSATTSTANDFVLGTSSHTVKVPGKLYVADKYYGSVDISANGSTTQTVDIDKGSFRITSLNKDITLSNPTGTPQDMQRFLMLFNADGTQRALTWGTAYRGGTTLLPPHVKANKTVICEFIYNATTATWDLLSANEDIV